MYEKFKRLLCEDHIFYGLLIVLVCVCSFGLGRLSVEPFSPTGHNAALVLSQEHVEAHSAASSTPAEQTVLKTETASVYVASKKGTKYHLPWCPGASQIKEENRVYFASKAEAQKAGYTAASNCKGI